MQRGVSPRKGARRIQLQDSTHFRPQSNERTLLCEDLVLAVITSANRDEHQFTEPNRIDLQRAPNFHVTLGEGIPTIVSACQWRGWRCRSLSMLLPREPELRLSQPRAALRWCRGMYVRGLEQLPMTLAG
jgi:cytochrome P450